MPSPRISFFSASLVALSITTPIPAIAANEAGAGEGQGQAVAPEAEVVDDVAATPDIIVTATRPEDLVDPGLFDEVRGLRAGQAVSLAVRAGAGLAGRWGGGTAGFLRCRPAVPASGLRPP